MLKRWMKVLIAAVVLALIVVVAVPFFVNVDTFRPRLQTQLSSTLGRPITLGHLSFSLLKGSIVAENISVADDPAFSSTPFLEAKSLNIGVEVGPLLFHHQVNITKLTIESPSIHLISKENGVWNFSSIGGSTSPTPSSTSEVSFPDLNVGELKIADGSATVSSLPSTGKPFTCNEINLDLQQFSFVKAFPFKLSASIPGSASFTLNGAAGPLAKPNAANTPFHATLQLKHFDPVAAGVVDPGDGIAMVVDIDSQINSDGRALTSSGKIQAAKLQLARSGSPAANPVNIDYNLAHDLEGRAGKVTDIAIHTGAVSAHVDGSYRLTPQAIVLDLHLSAPNLPIDQLVQLLPSVGVKLPSGSSLKGGTLTTSLAITGPATAVTLTGPVSIDNTQLAGFDLGSRIDGLNPFGGKGGGTNIQTLRADVVSSPDSTQLNNILANLPQIGTATGNGTVSASGALDFKLAAKFTATTGVGAIATQAQNALGNLLGGFGPLKSRAAGVTSNGIPLTISGTASDPHIRANLKAMLR
ncbi:MAG: AsmA family protein [Terracidiphilus sp.]|nr:AsmA family protein [Terracidiphilus sp.]